MAEASVALLISKATAALGAEAFRYANSLLREEALLLRQFQGKLRGVVAEFRVMQAFLRQLDAQGDQLRGSVQRAWVELVRDAAVEVEDIIDEYTYLLASRRGRCRDHLRKAVGRAPKPGSLPDIARRLEDVDSQLHRLSTMKERYGIRVQVVEEGSSSIGVVDDDTQRRRHVIDGSLRLPEDDEFVGMEESIATLLRWLTAGNQESSRKLITVWGMGGLGKTTLVTQLLKSQVVREHFNVQAAVTVSETYSVLDLLRRIVRECSVNKETTPDVDKMNETKLVETLNRLLQGKRYLLVLDDVWSPDVWSELKNLVTRPGGDIHGSTIVLTTRKREVASLGRDRVLELQPLIEDEAWLLFCKKAFANKRDIAACPEHLEHQAKAILRKCEGLPLAIVAMGGLLSLKEQEEQEWRKFYDNLNWQLVNNPQLEHLKNILFASFRELPVHLRHCLLYCGAFPKDFPIRRRRLIRLWVAEGLVQVRGILTMEEVAEDNLNELIYPGMLQVVERNNFGRVKACRMHDMIREVAMEISDREKFCSIHDNPQKALYREARRLSAHKVPNINENTERGISHLRSFLFFGKNSLTVSSLILTLSSTFKLLRVLDLQDSPIATVPENLYHLYNLHYLSLRGTKINEISESLGNLCNLETLNLKNTNLKQLPHSITKLKRLRHLIMGWDLSELILDNAYYLFTALKVPKGLWKLKDLQSLEVVEVSDEFVQHAENLVKMRSLDISGVRTVHCAKLGIVLSNMVELRSLGIIAKEEDREILDLDTLDSPPQYLQKLFVAGRVKNDILPRWFCFLKNVKALNLHWTRLREDPVPLIHGSLPNLEILGLNNAYVGNNIGFRAGWFPKLKSLVVINMPVEQVVIEKGALTKLENLGIGSCLQLNDISSVVEHLTNLQMLHLIELKPELIYKLRMDKDACRRIRGIQHIYRTDNGWHFDDLKNSS